MKIEDLIDRLPAAEREKVLLMAANYKEAVTREKCETNFLSFVREMWPGFIPGRHHAVVAKKFEELASGDLKRLIICMPPRHAIMTSMKIPTTSGFKTMADLQVGDFVFGPDGKPVEVLGKSEVFKGRELYRVTTDDGASLVVDGEHLWTVRLDRKRDVYHDYTTEQLWRRQNGESLKTTNTGKAVFIASQRIDPQNVRLPRLPDVLPVEYPEAELLVDPYVLGVWLGDGSKNSAVITAHDDDAQYTRAEIERRGYTTNDQSTRFTFSVLELQVKLKKLGVFNNKHIPRQYLEASAQQRRDLLKGLMDTDGNVSKAGQCFFAQSNKEFIDSVAELIRSLGIKANILESEAKIGDKSYGKSWKISFYANDVFCLPRKEERTLKNERKFGRYIKIEKLLETGDTQCIKVDREDGLFLAGEGYICTHNTKSELGSYMLPAWFLGRFPDKKVIQSSNTAELAVGFGRKVRNLIDSERYQSVFPNLSLRQDSKAAGRWATNHNGEYFAIGVGGTVTGKGADLLIIDDPHSEQEAALAATNPDVFDKVYEWYSSGPRQRLQPGGRIVIIMCMTGDTSVLMGDGTEKPLSQIKVGDKVATYVDGEIATSKILNWRSSGVDSIYKIQTQSGKILRANKEHPFLVDWKGVRKWARLQDLAVGMDLVSTKVVTDHLSQSQNPDCVSLATQKPHITPNTLMRRIIHWVTTASGKMQSALAASLFTPKACVLPVTDSSTNHQNTRRNKTGPEGSSIGTESLWSSMQLWLLSAIINVTFAATRPLAKILGLTGMESCALTTATTQIRSEDCFATTATWPLGTEKHRTFLFERLSTYDVTLDPIISIEPDGQEEVFDVEVEGSENFIANGIVVHNTRWSKRDLVGQVLKAEAQRGGEGWEIIEFPAIMPSGKPLWPEFWPLPELEALKAELPNSKWQAQYQQSPTSESAAIIKREWWKTWDKEDPPYCEYILQAWDTAFEANKRADYSACTTWGVFTMPDDTGLDQTNIILLDAFKDRLEFPSLKKKVLELYKDHSPDCLMVEKKASGAPLIYELRRMGISVEEYTPVRGAANNPNTKITRLNAVSDIFASGRVWAPNRQWAEEVIDEVASFPNSEHDDLTDTVSLAMMRFRRGGFIQTHLDEEDEPPQFRGRVQGYY